MNGKCEYNNKVLITMHRRENHHWIEEWFRTIEDLAVKYDDLEFIIPLHPNPNVQKHKSVFKKVKVVDPMSHEDLLNLLVKTKMVITDSGGIQEECSFFNKLCFTCRMVTERPEAIGQSTIMVKNPQELPLLFNKNLSKFEIEYESPFGDGRSSERIFNILSKII